MGKRCAVQPQHLIKNIVKPALLLFLISILRFVAILRGLAGIGVLRRCLSRGGSCGSATFDNLIEFAAIKPYAAALRAIVNLDALPVAHRQRHAANGAGHGGNLIFGSHLGGPFVETVVAKIGSRRR
jgi:hypothetical protein